MEERKYPSFVTVKTVFGEKVPVTTKEEYDELKQSISERFERLESRIAAIEKPLEKNTVTFKRDGERIMKMTTSGESHNKDWFGLQFNTKVPMSWTVTVETLGLEVWKITIITPNGITNSSVLRKTGDRPYASVEKILFHKYKWRLYTSDVSLEDYVGK